MIAAAGLLVLVGLGLFVAGVVTGATALYWSCVVVCVVAAILLVVARLRMRPSTPAAAHETTAEAPAEKGTPVAAAVTTPAPPAAEAPATTPAASTAPIAPEAAPDGEPPVEEVEVTDLLLVVDLEDEVLVIDEHPRYHVPGCRHLTGREGIPIPLDEARTDGFTPCGDCRPDATLAAQVRARQ